jgi:hypothetical protein
MTSAVKKELITAFLFMLLPACSTSSNGDKIFLDTDNLDSDTESETETEELDSGDVFPVKSDPAQFDTDVPVNKIFKIKFNDHLDADYLDPGDLYLHTGSLSRQLTVFYDPSAYELVAWPTTEMLANIVWQLDVVKGLKALDGSEIVPQTVAVFKTGDSKCDDKPYTNSDYTKDVAPVFNRRCSSCHNFKTAFSGLDISSAEAIAETAISRPSRQLPDWKIIIPYRPGKSYLIFKLIGDGLTGGKQMPRILTEDDKNPEPLTEQEYMIIRDWILMGAFF